MLAWNGKRSFGSYGWKHPLLNASPQANLSLQSSIQMTIAEIEKNLRFIGSATNRYSVQSALVILAQSIQYSFLGIQLTR
jgi:hypothetical protein